MRKIYLVDEFPLEENILKSSDYSSKIIYSFIGRPFLKIMNSKKEFIFSLLCDDKKLEIILNDTKYSDLFEQIFKKIIQYIYKIDQFNSIVIRNNLIDYQKNINEIIFNFKNIRSLRLFIQILKSYKFNMLLEESYRIDFKNKKLMNNPDVISRGFVNVNESAELFAQSKVIIKDAVLAALENEECGVYQIRLQILEALGEFLESEIGRKPVILPTILEV